MTNNCGSGFACCNGNCSSTTPPAVPTLISPADETNVNAGTIQFQWQNSTGTDRTNIKICKNISLSGECSSADLGSGVASKGITLSPGTYYWSVRAITACDKSGWSAFATSRKITVQAAPVQETCNGVDDDGDGRIDNKGSNKMDCMREIFHFVRKTDSNNNRLQMGEVSGVAPVAPANYEDPDWMASEGRHPSFLLYKDSYGLSSLKKLYYCTKGNKVGDYDNLYTTNYLTDCNSYDVKGESYFIGYIFNSDPSSTKSYANWLYSPYYNNAVKSKQLWRIRNTHTGQNMLTTYDPTITDMTANGWCCVNGPSDRCSGKYCTDGSATPVGWVLIPK